MFRQKLIIGLLAAALFTPTAMAKGGEGQGQEQGKGGMGSLLKQLDLSSDQQSQINSLMAQHKAQRQNRDPAEQAQWRSEMTALITADNFDSEQARALAEQQNASAVARMISRAQLQHQIYHLLTPEQQTKFVELLEQKGGKRGQQKQFKNN
jgi:protein CpxP